MHTTRGDNRRACRHTEASDSWHLSSPPTRRHPTEIHVLRKVWLINVMHAHASISFTNRASIGLINNSSCHDRFLPKIMYPDRVCRLPQSVSPDSVQVWACPIALFRSVLHNTGASSALIPVHITGESFFLKSVDFLLTAFPVYAT